MYNISSGEVYELPTDGWSFDMDLCLAVYGNKIVWDGYKPYYIFSQKIGLFTLGEEASSDSQEPIEEPVDEGPVEKPVEEPLEDSSEATENLQDYISALEDVNTGTKSSLIANLNNVVNMLEKGDDEKSIDRLEKLIETIEEQLLPKGRLSAEQAEYITTELDKIIVLIQDSDGVTPQNATGELVEGNILQITTSGKAEQPAIYGETIVWEDHRNGSNIYMYNVSTREEIQITTSGRAHRPTVYGDTIIWLLSRAPAVPTTYLNADIYMYNISTGEKNRVTTEESIIQHLSSPVIYKDKIVWNDKRSGNWETYMYNISTGEEQQISNNAFSAFYGDILVWVNHGAVYTEDIRTGEKNQISPEGVVTFGPPVIYEDKVIWSDNRDYRDEHVGVNLTEIYMYNISSRKESRITTSESAKYDPAIYGDIVVWADGYMVMSGETIHMCNISTGETFQLTPIGSTQMYPAIFGDKIVWQDSSDSGISWNIRMSILADQTLPDSQESTEEQEEEPVEDIEEEQEEEPVEEIEEEQEEEPVEEIEEEQEEEPVEGIN